VLSVEIKMETYSELLANKMNDVLMDEIHHRAYPTVQAGTYKSLLKSRLKSNGELGSEIKIKALMSFADELDRIVDHYEDVNNTQ
jgi:hypothetical protein